MSNSAVLSFSKVTVGAQYPYDAGLWDADFRLEHGELMLVRLERIHLRLPLADASAGLVEPQTGGVRFMDQDWRDLPPERGAALRGRIGRVFEDHGWISNLEIQDNITLAQRHHADRPEEEIEEEAVNLSRVFGLPGLSLGPVSGVLGQDLSRAACVRALLGRPDLVVLERPTRGVYPEIMPALVNSLRSARERGAAVLWTTSDARVWIDPDIRPSRKFAMLGSQLVFAGGGNAETL